MGEVLIQRQEGATIPAREGGRHLWATAKLVHLHGNARPYFSATAEVWNSEGWRLNGQDGRMHAGGRLHELIERYTPALRPVVAVHLRDDDGTPMHAEANGWYWYERGELDTLARVYGVPIGEIPGVVSREAFGEWVDELRPVWRAAAALALQALGAEWVVRHDGIIVWAGASEMAALGAIHGLQGASWDHAIKHEGYSVTHVASEIAETVR